MNRIIVMVDNRVGIIADIARALSEAGINVESSTPRRRAIRARLS